MKFHTDIICESSLKYICHPIKNMANAYKVTTEALGTLFGATLLILLICFVTKKFRANSIPGSVEGGPFNDANASLRQSPVSFWSFVIF